jgi:hypothetical protein
MAATSSSSVGASALQVLEHHALVKVGGGLNKLLVVLPGLLQVLLGDGDLADVGTQVVAVGVGLHPEDVYDPREGVLAADGELHDHGPRPQALLHGADDEPKVGPGLVHLVGEGDPGHLVLLRLAPDGLGLGLHPLAGVKDHDGPVQHPHGALHLNGEVHVAGGVNDVDAVVPPEAGGHGGGDGDAPLPFLLHEVHGGRALVHLADLVDLAGVVEDALGGGGLTGVNVRGDADVAKPL